MLSSIGVILLTMVGYSAGGTWAARDRDYLPGSADLWAVLGLWVGGLLLHGRLETQWVAIVAGLLSGFLVGLVVAQMRLAQKGDTPALPKSELPVHAQEKGETAVALSFFRQLWRRWTAFSARLGATQGRLLMGFVYFIFVTPFALGFKLTSDPLALKQPFPQSGWTAKETLDTTLETAQDQG